MDSDWVNGVLAALISVVLAIIICLSVIGWSYMIVAVLMEIGSSSIKSELIDHSCAYYHPETSKLVWKKDNAEIARVLSQIKQQAVNRGCGYYHPKTGVFTMNNEE
jgi:hypothetical protein